MSVYFLSSIESLHTIFYPLINQTFSNLLYLEFYSFNQINCFIVVLICCFCYNPLHWELFFFFVLSFISFESNKLAFFNDYCCNVSYDLLEGLLKQHPIYLYLQIFLAYNSTLFEFFFSINIIQVNTIILFLGWCFSIGMLWAKYNENWGLFWAGDLIEFIFLFFFVLIIVESHYFIQTQSETYPLFFIVVCLYLLLLVRLELLPTKHLFSTKFKNPFVNFLNTQYGVYSSISIRNNFFNLLFFLVYTLLNLNHCVDKFTKTENAILSFYLYLVFFYLMLFLCVCVSVSFYKSALFIFAIFFDFIVLLTLIMCFRFLCYQFFIFFSKLQLIFHYFFFIVFLQITFFNESIISYCIFNEFNNNLYTNLNLSFYFFETPNNLEIVLESVKKFYGMYDHVHIIFRDFHNSINSLNEFCLHFNFFVLDYFDLIMAEFKGFFAINFLKFDLIAHYNYLIYEKLILSI